MKSIEGLKQAQPYIRLYRDKIFVIKLGGGVLADEAARDSIAHQVGLMTDLGIKVVLVHGGGPQATKLSKRMGIEPEMIAGRRVTTDEVLDVVLMTYAGKINTEFVASLNQNGVKAVGLSGADSGTVVADRRPPVMITDDEGEERKVDFGHVGDIRDINTQLINDLFEGAYVPTICCLCHDSKGGMLNVNADSVAEAIAVALQAKKLIFLTEVDGLMSNRNDPNTLIPFADNRDLAELMAQGVVKAGMRPKVEACSRAATQGVKRTHIINGLNPDSLLTELFTGEGCGTMIVGVREKQKYQDEELA